MTRCWRSWKACDYADKLHTGVRTIKELGCTRGMSQMSASCPAYDFDNMPQQIRIVFDSMPGYVPTALVGLTLDDAERICDRLNAKLGLDRDAWSTIAGRSMSAARDEATH